MDGGAISGGTFSGKMSVRNRNQITGGTFNGYVWNYATISGGTFNGGIGNLGDTVIRGKMAAASGSTAPSITTKAPRRSSSPVSLARTPPYLRM